MARLVSETVTVSVRCWCSRRADTDKQPGAAGAKSEGLQDVAAEEEFLGAGLQGGQYQDDRQHRQPLPWLEGEVVGTRAERSLDCR